MTADQMPSIQPWVTVVIPAYNHAAYLPAAIESVLTQTYDYVELIVIDDGSTDHTLQMLNDIKGDFQWLTQQNRGQSRTLERGWQMAKGEILGYLSADDLLKPDAIRQAVQALQAQPDAIATYSDFELIDLHGRKVRTVTLPAFSYKDMLTKVSCPIGPGAFFKQKAYASAGAWNPAFRQMPDYDFWLRMGLQGGIIHLPHVLAAFRIHEGSQTFAVTSIERANESISIIQKTVTHPLADRFDQSLKNQALASAHLVSAQLHIRAGRFALASSSIKQAFRYSAVTVLSLRSMRLLVNAALNRTAHKLLWKIRSIMKEKSE